MDNVYADASYASSYAELDWPGTYYLLKRDLPGILTAHARGTKALDFGCGAGRSTRFLRDCGFETVGIDIAPAMIAQAQALDPGHDYRVIKDGDFSCLEPQKFDLILACFPFDNIPGAEHKASLISALRNLLAPEGVFVNVVSSPEIYWHEWATFTTAPFPGNRAARPGDIVQIITKDFADQPVCDDILCDDDTYRSLYAEAGLEPVASFRPLGHESDPVAWVSESTIAPWVIWVLRSQS